MGDLDHYFDKFSESGRRILERALNETRRRDQHFISPEHILYALIEEETELFDSTMRELAVDSNAVRLAVAKRLENSCKHTGRGFRIAPEATEIFKYSMDRARSQGRRVIEASDILYTMSGDKQSLLNDDLQSHAGHRCGSNPNRSDTEDQQSRFFSQSQTTSSKFLTQFSLRELANKNDSPSGLLFPKRETGGIGGTGGGLYSIDGDLEQTTNTKHETIFLQIKSEDSHKFDEAEFISSLKKDVENSISENRLKVKKANSQSSSGFRLEYEKGRMKGQIDISGEMKNGYYEMRAMIIEKNSQKTK